MKKTILFVLFCLVSFDTLLATGPSYIRSELMPIARNSKGDILCKTRYEENQMGSYGYMDIYYGLCVLTKKKIVEYPLFKLDAENYAEADIGQKKDESDKYCFLYNKWNNWFNSNTNKKTELENTLLNTYTFDDFDMDKYLMSDTIPVDVFRQKYKTNLSSKKMKTLRNAHSLAPDVSTKTIIVWYVFDDKIICKNVEFDDVSFGLEYNFKTDLFGGIPYDYFFIDGVLFK